MCDKYSIRNKLDYIISDNAANMKKAFTVCLAKNDGSQDLTATPVDDEGTDDDTQGDDNLDDDTLWEPLGYTDQTVVDQTLAAHCKQQRLGCYAHTLQLVVGDGLKEGRSARPALSKASRLSTLMHTSGLFRDQFEKKFGSKKGIQQLSSLAGTPPYDR